MEHGADDIVTGDDPGGATTSHTIGVDLLQSLLAAVSATGAADDYVAAAIEDNVIGKATAEGRRRGLRYLRELYLLEPTRLLFRALRDLWDEDPEAQPVLAGLSAYARDSVFRASGEAVLAAPVGSTMTSADLGAAIGRAFPDSYNRDSLAKLGRNTAASWAQTGHLLGRSTKTRVRVDARPAAAAYALLLGHVEGLRGQALFETRWTRVLDCDAHDMTRLAEQADRRGYLELKNAGGVVEIGFRHLLRPLDPGRST